MLSCGAPSNQRKLFQIFSHSEEIGEKKAFLCVCDSRRTWTFQIAAEGAQSQGAEHGRRAQEAGMLLVGR